MSDTPRTNAVVGDFNFPWSYQMEMLVRHAEQLERELEAALKDAERYRFLRDGKPNQLHLTRNDHACNYVSAKEWIEERDADNFKDEPPEALQAMKDADTIWCLQIYPATPIGFHWWHRATLDEVVDAAIADAVIDSAKESK